MKHPASRGSDLEAERAGVMAPDHEQLCFGGVACQLLVWLTVDMQNGRANFGIAGLKQYQITPT
nr:hypothetical protein [Microlunatus sp. Gsoil 973]